MLPLMSQIGTCGREKTPSPYFNSASFSGPGLVRLLECDAMKALFFVSKKQSFLKTRLEFGAELGVQLGGRSGKWLCWQRLGLVQLFSRFTMPFCFSEMGKR
jgi:hypothetical protein